MGTIPRTEIEVRGETATKQMLVIFLSPFCLLSRLLEIRAFNPIFLLLLL
jgi:hypothetical protein